MSSSESSDGGSEWDSSDLDSILSRPKGSPDIRHGLFFEDVEQFWEKHSPKVKKTNKNIDITDTLKKLSKIEEKQNTKRKDEKIKKNQNSNQISPIFPRHTVEKPQYNPDLLDSPQISITQQNNFDTTQNDDDFGFLPSIPSSSESSEMEEEIQAKTQKPKDSHHNDDSDVDSSDSMEPEELEEEQIIIRTPSSPKMILPPVAHLPSPKPDKKATEKKEGKENKQQKETENITKTKKKQEKDDKTKQSEKKVDKEERKEKDEDKAKRKKNREDKEKELEKEKEKKKLKEAEKKKKKEINEKYTLSQTIMKRQKLETPSKSSSQVIKTGRRGRPPKSKDSLSTPKSSKTTRKYNFDNYLDEDSDDQPTIILPEKPQQETTAEKDGPIALRRSQRVRVKPLKHWAGEYIQYTVGKDNLRSFSHIVRNAVDSIKNQNIKDSNEENDDERKENVKDKNSAKESKYNLTPVPFNQYEIIVDPDDDYTFPVQKFTRHVIHLDGIGRLYLSRHTYNLEDFADFIIPAGQEATISSKCNTRLRLLVIDYT